MAEDVRRPPGRLFYGVVGVAFVLFVAAVLSQGTTLLWLLPLMVAYLAVVIGLIEWSSRKRDPDGYEPPWQRVFSRQ